MHSAPFFVGIFAELYNWVIGRQTLHQMFSRLGDGFSRRAGASLGAAVAMGLVAPFLPYSGRFRNLAFLGFEYLGQYLGSFYAQSYSRKYLFGEPVSYGEPGSPSQVLQVALNGSKGAPPSISDIGDDGSFALRRSGENRRNGHQTPPGPQTPPGSRPQTPVANGDAAENGILRTASPHPVSRPMPRANPAQAASPNGHSSSHAEPEPPARAASPVTRPATPPSQPTISPVRTPAPAASPTPVDATDITPIAAPVAAPVATRPTVAPSAVPTGSRAAARLQRIKRNEEQVDADS